MIKELLGKILPVQAVSHLWEEPSNDYTLDYWLLSMYLTQNIFVYDDMMFGRHNHSLLNGAHRWGIGWTKKRFSVFKQGERLNTQVIPLESEYSRVPFLPMRGELYTVPTETLYSLDERMKNHHNFERTRVRIWFPNRAVYGFIKERDAVAYMNGDKNLGDTRMSEFRITPIQAHMYIGKDSHWANLLDAGYSCRICERFTKNIPIKNVTDYYFHL